MTRKKFVASLTLASLVGIPHPFDRARPTSLSRSAGGPSTLEAMAASVDWIEACNGPPEVDVGHCRLNLTVLFSADVADRFRAMYEEESGLRVEAAWDVHALLSYGPEWPQFISVQVDGRAPFDASGVTARMEDVLARALRGR